MNVKTEIALLAVRVISEKTNIAPKPDPLTELFSTIFGGETYEQRLARELVASSEKAVETIKKLNVNRKFKKIVKNV